MSQILHGSATRFARHRLEGLGDEPRPGTPRRIGDDEIADIIHLTLRATPLGATHWSRRLMARAVGYAPSTVHRIWRAFGVQPHRTAPFRLSNDPLFVDKARDIVGFYMAPPERAWCCVSMKTARSRRWTVASLCCRCVAAKWSGAPMTTSATARHPCSQPSISPLAR